MKLIRTIYSNETLDQYRSNTTGERLGWAILSDPARAFRPVHRIEFHEEDGPVIILGDSVFEVDPETDDVFGTDEEAMNAYYDRKDGN